MRVAVRKALSPAELAKSVDYPTPAESGVQPDAPMGGGVDQRTPSRVNRDPSKHRDRTGLAWPGGRRSRVPGPRAVSPSEAMLALAPDDAGHEEQARQAYKAAAPDWISVGSRRFDLVTLSKSGCCALYGQDGSDMRRGLFKRDSATGSLLPWQSLQCSHHDWWTKGR
jgi:hypothetical protein